METRPATIRRSDCLGLNRMTSAPKRERSNLLQAVAINSIPQHAVAKGNGQMLLRRAKFATLWNCVVRRFSTGNVASIPMDDPVLKNVGQLVVMTSVDVRRSFVRSFLDLEETFVAFLLAFTEVRFIDGPSVARRVLYPYNSLVAARCGCCEHTNTEGQQAPAKVL